MQPYRKLTRKAQLWIAVLFVFLFFVVSSYMSLIYNQYVVERQIERFRQDNERLTRQNRDKWIELVRLSLPRVMEKEAKANMNKIFPGEKVVIIREDESKNFVLRQQKNNPLSSSITEAEAFPDQPMMKRWWYYFFPPQNTV